MSPSSLGRRVAEKVMVVKKVKRKSKEQRKLLMEEGMVLGLFQRRRALVLEEKWKVDEWLMICS